MRDNGEVKPPAGAVRVDPWEVAAGVRFRFFRGTRRGDRVSVEVMGFQYEDGRVEQRVAHIHADHVDFDIDGLTELMDDLQATKDEIQRLESHSDD